MATMSAGHEGHEPGTYSALCRSCRIAGHLERIKEIGEGTIVEQQDPRISAARAFVGRFIFTEGQHKAIRMAAEAGVSLREFSEWVGASRREVVSR